MGLKTGYMVCGLLCYCGNLPYSNVRGEIDDILIQQRLTCGRDLVNFSTEKSRQFYFKDTVYDLQENGDGLYVTEWKIRRDGKKRKQNQFAVGENWSEELVVYMLENGITHNIYIDGRLAYRGVDKKETEKFSTSDDEGFLPVVDDPEDVEENTVIERKVDALSDTRQDLEVESNWEEDKEPQKKKSMVSRVLNFFAKTLGFRNETFD